MNLVGKFVSALDICVWLIGDTVKWLGKDALNPLAVDGKGGKAELLEKVARWVAARGRNVTQPGKLSPSPYCCSG